MDEKRIIFENFKKYAKVTFYHPYNVELITKFKATCIMFYNGEKGWSVSLQKEVYEEKQMTLKTYEDILKYYEGTVYLDRFNDFFKVMLDKHREKIEQLESIRKSKIEKWNSNSTLFDNILYKFQKDVVEQLCTTEKNHILALDMGTGKTICSISYAEIQKYKKVLIVVPASLKINWKKEILRLNKDAKIVIMPDEEVVGDEKYYIVNYDILAKRHFEKVKNAKGKIELHLLEDSLFNKEHFDLLIVDEAAYCKSDTALRSKAVLGISERIDNSLLLTGTPIKNHTMDLFNLLAIIKHPLGNNKFKYGLRFCAGHKNEMGYWDFSGSSNLHQLYDETKEQIIRKKKEDCLDLPPKIYNKIYLQLSKKEQNEYDAVFDRYIKFLREEKLANLEFYEADRKIRNIIYTQSLVEIGLMKQLTSKFKLPVVISRMEDILEEDDSRKIIIFSQYNETINLLVNHFGERCVKLTGSMNGNQREESVERFQNDKDVRVFVGNIQAAGVGITLTAGDTVMFADMAWTPADHDQAESRPHRIGQKNNVNIFYFITENTIEEKIYDLLETKRNIEKQVIDGQIIEEPAGNDSVLGNLIESLI